MNTFFKPIEGEAAVIASKGVYQQVDLYSRGGVLYAKRGGGFIRLLNGGATSQANVRWEFMSIAPSKTDALGRMWV